MVSDSWFCQIHQLQCYSLNPCSNGIWSLTRDEMAKYISRNSLNPCSNGIWSLTKGSTQFRPGPIVLILVLMEYGL